YVSERIGKATIRVESGGSQRGGSRSVTQGTKDHSEGSSYSWNQTSNWSVSPRELYRPEEVLALSPRTAICFVPGVRPFLTQLIRWYEEKWLRKRGWFARQRDAIGVLLQALLFGIVACGAAYLLTQLANETHAFERVEMLLNSKGGFF